MMNPIGFVINKLRNVIEKKDEIKEPSGGFLPYRVRQKTVSLLKNHGRLLDVGAGEGLLLKTIGPKTAKWFYCIDLDMNRLKQSSARWPNKAQTLFVFGDGLHLPFKDNVFDEVTLLNIFLNVSDEHVIAALLREALRVSHATGKVIFDYRNRRNLMIFLSYKTVTIHDPELELPLRGFSRGELEGILQSLSLGGGIVYYPIPSWWKVNPPAYLVEIQKRAEEAYI
jgi:ubiquinone/menaquinone biosynthesis C-methylase UbiE